MAAEPDDVAAIAAAAADDGKRRWSTLQKEVYGRDYARRTRKARKIRQRLINFLEKGDNLRLEGRVIKTLRKLTGKKQAYIETFIWWGPEAVPTYKTLQELSAATKQVIAKYKAKAARD